MNIDLMQKEFEAWWNGRGLPEGLKPAFYMVWQSAVAAAIAAQAQQVSSDYTVLIARLAYALKKADPENNLSLKAAEFLKRKGHTFNQLRDEPPAPEGDNRQRPSADWCRKKVFSMPDHDITISPPA